MSSKKLQLAIGGVSNLCSVKDCKAYTRKKPNGCYALNSVLGKNGVGCPFFKSKEAKQ